MMSQEKEVKEQEEKSTTSAESVEEVENEEVSEEELEAEVEEIKNKIAKLEEELEESEAEKEDYLNKLQRQRADFANYKRRVKEEKEELELDANRELINKLLPVLDNFERAIFSTDQNDDLESFLEGTRMIYKQIFNILEKEGLEVIPTIGEEFDPQVHEAVAKEPSEEYESGIVIEELQKGYLFNGHVLRAAMVKVAQ
ncbi:MAG: nucleotide exchange factor GrpE [Bacillota bacterium]